MRFGKLFICMVTAVFLLFAVFIKTRETVPDEFLSVEITTDGKTERINCHGLTDSEYYFFLPSYAQLSEVRLRTSERDTYAINGLPVVDGMTCEQVTLGDACALTKEGEPMGALTFVRSGGVGAVFLDTSSGNMDYIQEAKGNEETGKLRLYTQEGGLNHAGNILAINGRGNSTWKMEKKSYSVELPSEADLLGMGSAEKWILLSNALDNSNLRNKIVYDFAGEFGLPYSPDCDWVDLYLNGEYAGLYLLTERNEVHPERVDIAGTGSFLLARDSRSRMEAQGREYFKTEDGAPVRIYYADMSRDMLTATIQSLENAILAEDGIDPVTGKSWQELLDAESWASKYLIDEVFGNKDGTALSQFFYYDATDPSGKICAGPVWDYDLSMSLERGNLEKAIKRFYANVPEVPGAQWPDALYRKPEYYDRIVSLYETRFRPLVKAYMETVIPEYGWRIAEASRMNGIRWGYSGTESKYEDILQFLELRLAFLDDVWVTGETEYCRVNTRDLNYERKYYVVEKGSLLPAWLTPVSSDSGYDYHWEREDNEEVFALEEPVTEDISIKLRYEKVLSETQPEDTAPVETAAQIPEETAPRSPVETEAAPEEEIAKERIPMSRLAPALLFGAMLVMLSLAGLYQAFRDVPKEKKGEKVP